MGQRSAANDKVGIQILATQSLFMRYSVVVVRSAANDTVSVWSDHIHTIFSLPVALCALVRVQSGCSTADSGHSVRVCVSV